MQFISRNIRLIFSICMQVLYLSIITKNNNKISEINSVDQYSKILFFDQIEGNSCYKLARINNQARHSLSNFNHQKQMIIIWFYVLLYFPLLWDTVMCDYKPISIIKKFSSK